MWQKFVCNLNDWSATTVLDMGINFAQLSIYMDNSLPSFGCDLFVCLWADPPHHLITKKRQVLLFNFFCLCTLGICANKVNTMNILLGSLHPPLLALE